MPLSGERLLNLQEVMTQRVTADSGPRNWTWQNVTGLKPNLGSFSFALLKLNDMKDSYSTTYLVQFYEAATIDDGSESDATTLPGTRYGAKSSQSLSYLIVHWAFAIGWWLSNVRSVCVCVFVHVWRHELDKTQQCVMLSSADCQMNTSALIN